MAQTNYGELAGKDAETFSSTHNVLDEFKHLSVKDRKELCNFDRCGYSVAILNVTGELNAGVIVRTALLAGAKNVHIIGRRRIDNRPTVGAMNYLDIERHDAMIDETTIDCNRVIEIFEDNNLVPIYVEHGGEVIPNFNWNKTISEINFVGKTPVLVLGNENRGVPDDLLNRENAIIVSLPQKSVLRSYNVGVACGMVIMDMMNNMGWW